MCLLYEAPTSAKQKGLQKGKKGKQNEKKREKRRGRGKRKMVESSWPRRVFRAAAVLPVPVP
jgi:Mg-chelatase subunit ChlD